jgi:DNA replication protein DnaC
MNTASVDIAKLPFMLTSLRLPTFARLWPELTQRADREGWPAARLLAVLAEIEMAERVQRRIQRNLTEAGLPSGKTLDSFDFSAVPMVSKAHIMALASGDAWLAKGGTILMFGPPGSGKTHLSAALGAALVENGFRVLFTRTTDLVQRLQSARRDLALESAIDKLDKYDLIVLDDISYVHKDQAETSVLFELIEARYERRSIMITANRAFGIFEMNVESFRRRTAIQQRQPATSTWRQATSPTPIKISTSKPRCRRATSTSDIALEHKGRMSHNLYRGR